MSDELHDERIADLFARAKDLSAEDQARFIEPECRNDPPDVRQRVEKLLAADRQLHITADLQSPDPTGRRSFSGLHSSSESTATAQEVMEAPLIERGPDADRLAQKLGKFTVLKVLGEGGQGSAMLAFDPDLRRRVVIKQYHVTERGSDQERLLNEGRSLVRVESPYVARCLGVERIGEKAYLVVEYVPGTTLAQRHEREPLSPRKAARILEQTSAGAAAIHAAGLLHRDIKPANIILGDDDVPRLVDFGLATPLASDGLHETAGTPQYMAPEQARGEGERIDRRADVFALGAVLYYLLTGRAPYEGRSRVVVLEQAHRGEFTRPRELNPNAPRTLERICLKAMAASPKHRYASGEALAGALRRYRRRPLIAASVAAAAIIAVCAVYLLYVLSSTEELSGELIASLWSQDDSKRGLRVNEPGALPAKAGELVHLEARFNQPAHAYLLWIDGQGEISAIYPWNLQSGLPEEIPKQEAREVVHYPPEYDRGLELGKEPGLETVLLLARRSPLPHDVSLKELVSALPPSPLRDEREWAIVNPDLPVQKRTAGRHRGIDTSQTKAIDDPLLKLIERLRPYFEVIRAVRFAYTGE